MHRNDVPHIEQADRQRRFARAHRVMVADGQHGHLGRVKVSDYFHVAKNRGVPSVVDGKPPGKPKNKTAGPPAVNDLIPILNSTGVHGVDHGHFDLAYFLRTTFVHRAGPRDAFRFEPGAKFKNPHDLRLEFLSQFNGIGDVIEMAVGHQHGIDALEFLVLFRAHRVRQNPGIDENNLTVWSLDAKSCVAEPRKFVSSSVEHDAISSIDIDAGWWRRSKETTTFRPAAKQSPESPEKPAQIVAWAGCPERIQLRSRLFRKTWSAAWCLSIAD